MGALLFPFLIAALFVIPIGVGVIMARLFDQEARDKDRRTYKLSFPADLDEERVTAWLRASTGTLRARPMTFKGLPAVTFELVGTNKGLQHRMRVPSKQADFLISQLHSLVPGVGVEEETVRPPQKWTRAAELGLTHSSRTLRIFSPTDLAASILASMQPLQDGEQVLIQWTVTPAPPSHKPIYQQATTHEIHPRLLTKGNLASRDEVKERRDKLEEPNVLAVLRVAAHAANEGRAHNLLFRVRAALSAIHGPSTRFYRRLLTKKELEKRINDAVSPMVFPMQLSATELTGLLAWPLGNPRVPGLEATRSRLMPVPSSVLSDEIAIGRSSFPGNQRRVAIGYHQGLMHTGVLGRTGTGKSVLLSNMGGQIMKAGYGLILIETEGNLYKSVLDMVPSSRIQDVVLFDVQDRQWPIGFNIMDQGHAMTVIDQVLDLFAHRYGKEGMGVWSQEYIYHGLRTIAEAPNLSFIDIVTLLNPRTPEEVQWVDSIVRQVKDPELLRWWQHHDNLDKRQQQQRADPVLSRVWQLSSRPELRYIMGQSKSTFTISDIMKRHGILLVNLKGVSKETASLAGTLIMNAIWHATKTVVKDKPTYLILDEFADFMDLPIDTESMLAQSRKHNLGMILANQHLSQLKTSVRDAWISSTRSKVLFQTNGDDARLLAREVDGAIDPGDLTNLQNYEALAIVQTPVGTSNPFSIKTFPPAARTGNTQAVIDYSRATYSRKLNDVKREIDERYKPDRSSRRRQPKISGQDDGW